MDRMSYFFKKIVGQYCTALLKNVSSLDKIVSMKMF